MARMTISQLRSLYEGKCSEVEGLKQRIALLEETRARSAQAPSAQAPSAQRSLMQISKLIATKFKCTTRINGDVVEYFKPRAREWAAVPNTAINEVIA